MFVISGHGEKKYLDLRNLLTQLPLYFIIFIDKTLDLKEQTKPKKEQPKNWESIQLPRIGKVFKQPKQQKKKPHQLSKSGHPLHNSIQGSAWLLYLILK